MRYLNFKKISLENFCGYTDPMDFTFENNKITLITGPNGIGKSTIFSAIPFALYGVSQTGQKPDDVLNNKVGKNCRVDCQFSIDDIDYMVTRTVKYTKIGSTAMLFKKGTTEPIAKGYREVTNTIENLLIPKDLFLNTVLFGQKVKTFFTDLPDSKQKEIFRKILQLDNYVQYQKNSTQKITYIQNIIDKIKNDISIKQSEIDILKNQNIKDIEQTIKSKQTNIENCNWEKNEKEFELKEQNIELRDLDENEVKLKYEKISNKIQFNEAEIENITNLVESKISEFISKQDLEIMNVKEEIHKNEKHIIEIKNNSINNLKEATQNEIDKLQEIINNLRDEYINEKSKLIQLYDDQQKDIENKFKLSIENNETEISKIIEQINNIDIETSKIQTIIDFASTKIRGYKNAIEQKSSICPTCFQKWDNIDHIQKMIDDENNIVVKNSDVLNEKLTIKKQFENEKSDLENAINQLKKDASQQIVELEEKKKSVINDFNDKYTNKANNYKLNIDELKSKLKNDISEIEKQVELKFDELNKDLVEKTNDIKKKYTKLLNELKIENVKKQEKIENEIKDDKEKLIGIKHKLAHIESIKNKISIIENEINLCDQRIVDFVNDIKNLEKNIVDLNTKIHDIEESLIEKENELTSLQKDIEICSFWKIGFSSAGIPSMLIDESIPFMNKRISEYLEQMSNGRYNVSFDTLKETKSGEFRDKISIRVYDSLTHSDSRINLSGGQTRLVDIATILTLSDLQEDIHNFKINILLFDEIFDALDDQNIVNVSNMLRRILSENRSINIITHRHIDQVESDNVYNFK